MGRCRANLVGLTKPKVGPQRLTAVFFAVYVEIGQRHIRHFARFFRGYSPSFALHVGNGLTDSFNIRHGMHIDSSKTCAFFAGQAVSIIPPDESGLKIRVEWTGAALYSCRC